MRNLNLQGWARRLVGAVDSLGVNHGGMVLVNFLVGVVGGSSGRTKSQGSKGDSHRRAHGDLYFGLMLVMVESVQVCLFRFFRSLREWRKRRLKAIIITNTAVSIIGD